ncbi:MAG TPA: ion channel [Actinomycetota bacterium]|nr:ion channel [Actinomycetota bacterium]
MKVVQWIALPAGILLVVFTLLDVFSTIVVPRSSSRRFRLTRVLFTSFWRPWRWFGLRAKTRESRERILAVAAPGFLFVLLAVWAFLVMVGYALILWSPAFVNGVHGQGDGSFLTCLYLSGTSLFTIGFGDVVATGATRAIVIAEGATGLGLVAVVIAYLPVLYASFNRREVGIMLLDARAGSPPSGPELLRHAAAAHDKAGLSGLFADWERWAADILETHLSYPLLAFFRSPHDNTSWVTALGSVLDAATLILSAMDKEPLPAAQTFYRTGVHAVEDLFFYFRVEERRPMIERSEFEDVLRDFKDLGIPVRPPDESWERFQEMRKAYGGRLDALALLLASPPAQWIGDRSTLPVGPTHDR